MLKEGSILLLEVDGRLTAGVALSMDQSTVRALVEGGEKKLKFDKILRASSARVSAPSSSAKALEEAQSYVARVSRLAEDADLQALWELASEVGEELALEDLADLAFPEQGGAGVDAMAVALVRDRTYFKARKEGFSANPARTVEAIRAQVAAEAAQRREEDEVAAAVTQALELARAGEALPPVLPGAPSSLARGLDLVRELALYGVESPRANRASALLRRVLPSGYDPGPFDAFDVLVALGIWRPDENLDVHRQRIRVAFPGEVCEAAEALAAESLEHRLEAAAQSGRRRYRDGYLVAIDDATTRDVDDALSVRALGDDHFEVHVIIADPGELIPRGSPLELEARQRASTLYLPDQTIPMLPHAVSEGLASLVPGRERFALLFRFVVTPSGDAQHFSVEEVIACLDERVTYDDADEMFERNRPEVGGHVAALLSELLVVARRLRARRLASGAVALQQAEVKVRVEENGISIKRVPPGSPSRDLVAELMIATGVLTARHCWERGVPAVYRWQDSPDSPIAFEPDRAADPLFIQEVLQTMRKAELAGEPRPHYGLGVDSYTQVTSPIRRYQDLAMHQQLKGYLRTGVAPLGEREILDVFAEVEGTSSAFGRIERDAKRYWILKWLEKNFRETFEGIVLRPLGPRWLLHLPALGLNEAASATRPVEPGDVVRVGIKAVDARRDRLVLQSG